MTFTEKNTLARTLMLGVGLAAMLVLGFHVDGLVGSTKQDEHAVSVSGVGLLDTGKNFIPKQQLDMEKVNGVVRGARSIEDATKTKIDATAPTITAATSFMQKLNVSADKLNAPCPPDDSDKLHPCGTIADVAKTLNTGRHTLGEVEISVHKFNSHEDDLFLQEKDTSAKANAAIDNFNALVSDKDFKTIAAHIATGSGTFDHMLETGDKVETKITKCTLKPTFACQFRAWLLPTAQVVGAVVTK